MPTSQHLMKIDKLKYIRSYLTGAAKAAIEDILLAEDGYDAPDNILEERFRQKYLLMADNVDGLLTIIPVKTPAGVERLRSLYDQISCRPKRIDGPRCCAQPVHCHHP
ncbi:hypothetical protein HPB48_008016 [Haemaphysalis longicornis]|uniref:Uncharacterized protein n=1 Tax=Haemaphysalis longicornis TaxID=44386 RepID=A0A9J6GAY9_HAELO|nr:hypothetical protein HPB48_008016 [Haemaphysalis longicornis]